MVVARLLKFTPKVIKQFVAVDELVGLVEKLTVFTIDKDRNRSGLVTLNELEPVRPFDICRCLPLTVTRYFANGNTINNPPSQTDVGISNGTGVGSFRFFTVLKTSTPIRSSSSGSRLTTHSLTPSHLSRRSFKDQQGSHLQSRQRMVIQYYRPSSGYYQVRLR